MRRIVGGAVAVGLAFAVLAAPAATPDQTRLATEVRAIFAAKCVECHGEELRHPKAHFGYVLDLARVAANPKMIVPGDPDESELYQLVLDDEMPGKDAKAAPLTVAEKETVKRWIEAGAPATEPSHASDSGRQRFTFWQRIVRALGQFHPPLAHFPIAFLIAAAPAELMWKLTRKRSWKAAVRFCVTTGALSAVVAATLGWCDAAFTKESADALALLTWHRWVGTATAVLAIATAVLSEFSHQLNRPRVWRHCFRVVLLGSVIAVGAAGYLGAALIYGLDHFRW